MKQVLVVGGTSGMGLALARTYAAEGAQVRVIGRDPARLPEDARRAGIEAFRGDVTDSTGIRGLVRKACAEGMDVLIYSAGFYATPEQIRLDAANAARITATNVEGITHVLDAALPAMREGGRVAVIASIAGLLRVDPWSTPYAKSKAAAMAVVERYRAEADRRGVGITLLIPGYVDTRQLQTLNGGTAAGKPFLRSEAEAVGIMRTALDQGLVRRVFPWQLHALVRMYNLLPAFLRGLRT